MFEISINACIKTELVKLRDNCDVSCDEIDRYLENGSIPMSGLLSIYDNYLKEKITMKKLMTPLSYKFKEKVVPGSNYSEDFKKSLAKLKLQQDEEEYQNMIKKSDLITGGRGPDEEITLAQINRQIKEQITTVFNILVSVGSVVFAVWYWSGSSARLAPQYRVLLCLFFGILVLVAEVVVYNSYLTKIHEAKTKEQSKKETKKVVKTLTFSGQKDKVE